jgi:hypothetical protein
MKTWIPDGRNFAYLNWKQVEALPKDTTLLVLPTAAIEQHGHHLPLATDTLINNVLLGRALSLLSPDLPIYALPPVCYGKSNEHIGFPGTIAMTATTYMSVLHDIGASLSASGFKKLVLYNSHGGNTSLNDVMARDLRAEFGLRTFHMGASAGAKAEGLPNSSTRRPTPSTTSPASKTTASSLPSKAPSTSPGLPATSPPAASWATRVLPPPTTAKNGSPPQQQKSPQH